MSTEDTSGFIYIIHVREFLRYKKAVYKIGRTTDPKTRFAGYPKGSEFKLIVPCTDTNNEGKISIYLK